MFLGGLWHGAAWSYAIWGTFHGLLLAIERFGMNLVKLPNNRLVITIQRLVVFSLVTLSWLLFKLPEFNHVIQYLQAMGNNTIALDKEAALLCLRIALYSSPVVIYHIFYLVRDKRWYIKLKRFEYLVYGTMLFLIITNSGTANAFIYFQF